ncbi:MAG: alpha/beta hydrolase fold domain-containing protein [Algibacter sp.]|uniref:alpha/beta hydrolase fold domain-containing protein n=1 Tax=Algibacter sp. TaxID=1872428 RepID=UPI0032976447
MKTKLLFLITFFFIFNTFAQSETCGNIINDTFDSGTITTNGWTEYNTEGRVTVENGRLKFNHNTTKPSAYRTFTPITKNTSFSFDVAASRNSVNCQIHLLSSTGKHLSSIAVGVKTASIKYASTFRNNIPNDFLAGDPPGGLFTNTTYNVRSEIDFESKTVSFYNDNVLMAADIPFLEDAEDIAKIDIQLIYMYSNNGQFYFDNISVLSGDANRLELTSNTIDAETLINSASIGNDYDQYPQSSVDAFQAEIDKANIVVDNCDAPSDDIDTALIDLENAQEIFIAARNSGLVLSLENAKGIVTDNLGSVIRWENQVDGYGDAVQNDTNLGAEESQETYPGKTTVLFNKEGSYLELEGSSNHISDNNYSVFYVGKAENATADKPASLLGNYDMSGGFSNSKGIRFVKLQDGKIGFDYARPNYTRVNLGTNDIPADDYFFFGFTMDASGNYKYFDSSSPVISTGQITNSMHVNSSENLKFNIFEEVAGAKTYNHTEVVELEMYDLALNEIKFQEQYDRLALEYADLVKSAFSITEVLPLTRTSLPQDGDITITFSQNVDDSSDYPKIFINKSDIEASGTWNLSPANTLTFSPDENWPTNALVTVKIQDGLKSTDGVFVGLAKGDTYNFIVESDKIYEYVNYELDEPIATVDYPITGHKLPLKLTTPVINENTTEKFPVHIWVHGGGWSGGTQESSSASYSPHGDYLAENLGIATLGISYRCSGSSGTFSLAMEDVITAYQWALDHAEEYNFDMTKVFFSGGSAGTPLAALASQQLPNVLGFIGFNGIYDFVNDSGDFGAGNWYKQNIPSEEENSPIFQLSENPPATIMMHGDADTTISHNQSIRFADAINNKGGSAEAVIYPGEVHAFFNLGKPAYEDVLIEMVAFITGILEEASLSTKTIDNEHIIKAYPNPVKKSGLLHIELGDSSNKKKVKAQVINFLGQVVLDFSADSVTNFKTLDVDASKLQKGTYFLNIKISETSETIKFVVQ